MPGIFISYRRNESAGHAGRLFDRLTARFGDDRVFMDVDTLGPSDHFATRIEKAIATADVMLVLIGPNWMAQADRLARPRTSSAARSWPPCASNAGSCPCVSTARRCRTPAALPADLRPLVGNECAVLRHGEFGRDCDHLADVLAAFVRPSAEAMRRGLSAALARAGWPLSWWAGLVRRTSPRAALAIAAVPIALVWALTVAGAWWQGQQGQGDDFTQLQVTDNAVKATAGFLNGTVTDDVDRIVEDAVVTLSNLDAQRNTETTTDSSGEFTIPYEAVGATSQSRLELAVSKPRYKKYRETFVGNALRYRRSLRPETEVAHVP